MTSTKWCTLTRKLLVHFTRKMTLNEGYAYSIHSIFTQSSHRMRLRTSCLAWIKRWSAPEPDQRIRSMKNITPTKHYSSTLHQVVKSVILSHLTAKLAQATRLRQTRRTFTPWSHGASLLFEKYGQASRTFVTDRGMVSKTWSLRCGTVNAKPPTSSARRQAPQQRQMDNCLDEHAGRRFTECRSSDWSRTPIYRINTSSLQRRSSRAVLVLAWSKALRRLEQIEASLQKPSSCRTTGTIERRIGR